MNSDPTNIVARTGDPITSWTELAPFISLGLDRGDMIGRHIAMTYLFSMAEVADGVGPIRVDAAETREALVDPIKQVIDVLMTISTGLKYLPVHQRGTEAAKMAREALATYQRAVCPP